MSLIEQFEHTFPDKQLIEIGITNESKPDKYLGLYFDWNKENGRIQQRVNYYIGTCWLEENKLALHVSPKVKNLNYLQIFLECLSNPIVAKHFNKTYRIFFNQPPIQIKSKNNIDITLLLIVHFLSIVKRISQKGLKKGYVTITENLSGKVKGKINIQQTIRKNLSSKRLDRNICQYQIHTQDCLENRLIKTAIKQVSKYTHRYIEKSNNNDELFKLLKYNQFSFESISEIMVSPHDFKSIKHSSFYAEYKEALRLAEMIFKRLGFNPRQNEDQISKTPPFYINMPELFERYVEVQLRKNYPDILVGYGKEGHSETRSTWDLRPDFLIPCLSMIIDAKYKVWYHNETDVDFKSDFQQLSLYARTKDILEKLGSKNLLPKLVFIYPPGKAGETEINLNILKTESKFEDIYKIGISLPTL
jgi:5-methylcytosine-specific restriction enzyme subunit McrC